MRLKHSLCFVYFDRVDSRKDCDSSDVGDASRQMHDGSDMSSGTSRDVRGQLICLHDGHTSSLFTPQWQSSARRHASWTWQDTTTTIPHDAALPCASLLCARMTFCSQAQGQKRKTGGDRTEGRRHRTGFGAFSCSIAHTHVSIPFSRTPSPSMRPCFGIGHGSAGFIS
ncbi:hypothetical protein CCHR01_10803 [Colletotrichum chrysophilum]|uniref:Uncharacterized protein n=1 Tax=Colletotrichum chrysophilum TaxID=1836956 RepID=A0AAD9AEA4_9PEZI|nr:hypothetical protein CCHR01_10803 [Colletotrichum chrysophilum]